MQHNVNFICFREERVFQGEKPAEMNMFPVVSCDNDEDSDLALVKDDIRKGY